MKFRLEINIHPSSSSKKDRVMKMEEYFKAPDRDSAIEVAGDLITVVNLEHDKLEGYDLRTRLWVEKKVRGLEYPVERIVWVFDIINGKLVIKKKILFS